MSEQYLSVSVVPLESTVISNFKKQTKNWDKQKTTSVPHHEKYFNY